MKKIMSPSKTMMTHGQIEKVVAKYRDMLEKHANEFDSATFQKVIERSALIKEQFAVFRRYMDAMSNYIVRTVHVDRARSPHEMLESTHRTLYIAGKDADEEAETLRNMPQHGLENVEITFFEIKNKDLKDLFRSDIEREYARRGLKPADPYALIAVYQEEPELHGEKGGATLYQGLNGQLYYLCFSRDFSDGAHNFDLRDVEQSDTIPQGYFAGVEK